MKHLFVVFLLCSFSVRNDDFYGQVLSKNSTDTRFEYYVAIPIYNNGDTLKCIVTSHFLYTYLCLEKKDTLSYEQYRRDVQRLLTENRGIDVRVPLEQLYARWRFQKVEQNNEIDSIARFGKDYFIQYYFDYLSSFQVESWDKKTP
jgi:hypothetical protein